ncbi:TPR/glycosyl transferase domain protein [Lunatimonas lonarensis]|uniref:TPR/glycosyl transferase domain protein n=1 Tax=Lunatimonas lonarensis TaxID=1232681 RepID=R7ZX71_9BACT|nr:TPR/glycosyl transferase domain protein [Lunatimonas lonarensis]
MIITYYWPPSSGSGVQRWLKFAKYLPQFGWDPVIFTPENPDFELKDPSLLCEVDPQLEVLRFPIWEPYQLFRYLKKDGIKDPSVILERRKKSWLDRLAIWIRANTLIPDPRVFWVRPSVKFLREIAEVNNFAAIITTGPPHSMHLIGRNLKRATGLPWLADFRDPWSAWEFLDTLPMTAGVRAKHRQLEDSVFSEADALMTISPTFQEEMKQLTNRPVHLLTNGFDEADLPSDFSYKQESYDIFEVVYTGVIDAIRNPLPFLHAFREVFQKSGEAVRLTFVGKVSDQVKEFVAKDPWLAQRTVFPGYISHEAVFTYYGKAHLLLLILTDTKNAKGNIPGKLFEYLATGRRIIALGDAEGDAAKLIHHAEAGRVISHTKPREIERFLSLAFELRRTNPPRKGVGRYSRRNLTGSLAEILREIELAKDGKE